MALPKINSTPEYELVIPSTKERVQFRPFVVKEQKVLLIALESRDQKQILNAITNTIEACLKKEINVSNLASYDLEYIFTQIRAKSVGEVSNIRIKCSKCEEFNDYSIDLTTLTVESPSTQNTVKLTDQVTVKLKTPSYGTMLSNQSLSKAKTQTEALIEMLIMSLDSLQTEEDNISFKDEKREDVLDFIDNLNSTQLTDLLAWVNTMPTLKHNAVFTCSSCSHENSTTLQGLSDFF